MRGASSSHCAAALRIGRIARNLMGADIDRVLVEFDPSGSLPTTHESQGSDMGLFGGLLGWDAADDRLPRSDEAIRQAGIEIEFLTRAYGDLHPNTYRLTLSGAEGEHSLIAISTGGGMIEVISIDGADVSLQGDYHETLVYGDRARLKALQTSVEAEGVHLHEARDQPFLRIQTTRVLPDVEGVRMIRLEPVLPVLSRRDLAVPFLTTEAMLARAEGTPLDLADLAIEYEAARGGITPVEVLSRMKGIAALLRKSIAEGIAGTKYEDRILGHQCGAFREQMESGKLLEAGLLNHMILYVTALMEVKSSMGVIVAAPTAGACGTFPGACLAAADVLSLDEEATARAFLAGGMVGVFIAAGSSFAAEVGGCQAETGSGAAMAAGALVTIQGGTLQQAMTASSIALQNTFGMICDPVANRVEAPCLGKNVMGAANALSCANVALAGYDAVIPFDEVVAAHYAVGNQIPAELRCTALGGLSITPTSKAIEKDLAAKKSGCGSCG